MLNNKPHLIDNKGSNYFHFSIDLAGLELLV